MVDYGVMSFAEIARRLNTSCVEVEKIYFCAMRKILHPSNKDKWQKLLREHYGEAIARRVIQNGSWRVRGILYES